MRRAWQAATSRASDIVAAHRPALLLGVSPTRRTCRRSTRVDQRVGDRAEANNVEIACTPTNSSWFNRIEAQFTALRSFAPDGTDHRSHKEQGGMIRRHIIWRNRQADDTRPGQVVARANVA